MYAARGLTANEIRQVTQVHCPDIVAYCKKEGVKLHRLPRGVSWKDTAPSDPDELRARWAALLGPMKARLREAILYDAA